MNHAYLGTSHVQVDGTGFFRTEEIDGRWWFITPDGEGFLSLGINHIDSSSLKYPDNIHIWRASFKDEEDFLTNCVRSDLLDWGFNTIGWTQEMGVRFLDHGLPWNHKSYKVAGLPYCHLIRFTAMEMWNKNFSLPDVFSDDFEDWCDFQARQVCPDMADDPMLIGYFYSDIPAWKTSKHGPGWMDQYDMESSAGRADSAASVERYYQVIHDAIRRYDPNHLLLGDRYNGNPGVPDEILEIAQRTVDVVSVQHFVSIDEFIKNSRHYHDITGLPVINADVGFHIAMFGAAGNPHGVSTQAERGEAYAKWARACFEEPHFIGWHWCAYIENKARQAGLKDRQNRPFTDAIELIREFNTNLYDWTAFKGGES